MISGWRNILSLYFNFVLTFGYDNLSHSKNATQSSRNNDTTASPDKAVDRDITTCSSTGADNPAWWYVDLEKIQSIHDIKINFKGADIADQQGQRELMYGYQLYVSNTTDLNSLDSMHHYYNHSGHTLPNLTSTHVCTTFGRYVIFYNERIPGMTFLYSNGMIKNFTHVQLCEMDVKGCDTPATYGDECNRRCPSKCQEERCHITNGTCLGCMEGWKGDNCENRCPEGYYGLECRGICSNNCQENRTCNHVTGDCDNGCSDGWTGERCNKTCGPGRYGQNCSYVCSRNCKDAKCDPVHGKCRCKQGWRGSDCSTECSNSTFGENCLQNCSGHCRNNEVCNNTNGECPNGCNCNYEDVSCHKMSMSCKNFILILISITWNLNLSALVPCLLFY